MQQDIKISIFEEESKHVKKVIFYHKLGKVLPMTKRFTRKQQLDNLKIQSGKDLIRSFKIVSSLYNADDEQSVWEYNAVTEEMLSRMAY